MAYPIRSTASQNTPQGELVALTEKLLGDLGLTECADVLIGNELIKGISGGQRKRTSVAVEIITEPSLLFLDEPTSGLDSHTASSLVVLLKDIAQRGSAVLCTIHQPSSEVFALFDRCIVMREGRIFYQGDVAAILPHFASLGCPCPTLYNPADFVMNLSQVRTITIIYAYAEHHI
jgi:ABC-type multidrug transport system ATPase subunit